MSDAGTVAAATSAAYAADMAGEIYRNVYATNLRTQDSAKDLTFIQGALEGMIPALGDCLREIQQQLTNIEQENQTLRQEIAELKAAQPSQNYTPFVR